MKIKNINNYDTAIGELIVYTGMNVLIFGGLYSKFGLVWIGIAGMMLEIILIAAIVSKIRVAELFSYRLIYYGFFSQKKTVLLNESQVEISLNEVVRSPSYTRSYSMMLYVNGKKIVSFRLRTNNWEFEQFYHNTKGIGISWVIKDDLKERIDKNYQAYMKHL